jgi:ssDNA-specific exonuclease RecJ
MLWSQFSAIFDIFRLKNGVFLKTNNKIYFYKNYSSLIKKRQFFRQKIGKNIFKIIT